jgi:RNA polymerase sigma-B factor
VPRNTANGNKAEQLGLGEEVLEALAVASTRWEVSLDQPAGDDPDGRLGDLVAASAAREEPEDLLALPGLVARLPELEREVIVLRFFRELDQDSIAARVGFSQMHVSRLQRRALARMRASLDAVSLLMGVPWRIGRLLIGADGWAYFGRGLLT